MRIICPGDFHPGIVGTAHLVSQYAVKSNRTYRTLLQTIRGLHRDPFDSALRTRLQRLAERLATEANRSVAATQAVRKKLGLFVDDVKDDKTDLGPIKQDLLGKYEAEDKQRKEIDEQLAKAEDELATANERYARDVTVVALTPVFRTVGFLLFGWWGDLAYIIVPAVAGTDSAKAKADIDAAIKKIEKLKEQKRTELRVRAALRLADRAGAEIAASADAVLPALEKAILGWGQLAGDIERLKSAATDDPASVPLLFREAEIEAARVAWQRLARAADDFRVHAYIRILPEEAEDEEGAESKDEDPAGKVGAEAPGKEDAHGQY